MGRRGKPSPASSPLRGLPSPLLLGALPLKPQNMPFYDVCEANSITTSALFFSRNNSSVLEHNYFLRFKKCGIIKLCFITTIRFAK